MALTAEQQAKIEKVSSSTLCGFLRGTATIMDKSGSGIKIGTGVLATGIHMVADGVETAGVKTDGVLKSGATALRNKADQYDLSDVTEEQLVQAMQMDDKAMV